MNVTTICCWGLCSLANCFICLFLNNSHGVEGRNVVADKHRLETITLDDLKQQVTVNKEADTFWDGQKFCCKNWEATIHCFTICTNHASFMVSNDKPTPQKLWSFAIAASTFCLWLPTEGAIHFFSTGVIGINLNELRVHQGIILPECWSSLDNEFPRVSCFHEWSNCVQTLGTKLAPYINRMNQICKRGSWSILPQTRSTRWSYEAKSYIYLH